MQIPNQIYVAFKIQLYLANDYFFGMELEWLNTNNLSEIM